MLQTSAPSVLTTSHSPGEETGCRMSEKHACFYSAVEADTQGRFHRSPSSLRSTTTAFCSVLGPKKLHVGRKRRQVAREMLPTGLPGEQSGGFRRRQVSPLFQSSHSPLGFYQTPTLVLRVFTNHPKSKECFHFYNNNKKITPPPTPKK